MKNEFEKEVLLETAKGMMYCADSWEIYCEIMNTFCEIRMLLVEELSEYLNAKDWKNYTIKMHALKNNARSISANVMGDLCYELELAGKKIQAGEDVAKQEALIVEKYPKMLLIFEQTAEAAKDYMEKV